MYIYIYMYYDIKNMNDKNSDNNSNNNHDNNSCYADLLRRSWCGRLFWEEQVVRAALARAFRRCLIHCWILFFLANTARERSVVFRTGLYIYISPRALDPLALIRAEQPIIDSSLVPDPPLDGPARDLLTDVEQQHGALVKRS